MGQVFRKGLAVFSLFAARNHTDYWLASLGAALSILGVYWGASYWLTSQDAVFMLASMGASAALLFASPHAPLSQPWPVLCGHLLSALVGVSCYRFCPWPWLAPALAAGGAVLLMHYAHCLHPPGAATALAAVLGSDQVHALGYAFLLFPVGVNVLVLLLCALLFNAPFAVRRYPHAWARRRIPSDS